MSDYDVVNDIAKKKMVETIISNVGKGTFPCTDDLAQDIYLELLNKVDKKPTYLVQLTQKKQLNFYITRMVMNNLFSKNSRYYYNYLRYEQLKSDEPFEENNDTEIDSYDEY